jgi:hypothetical protein
MKTRRMIYPILVGLIAIVLPIALGACSTLLPASSGSALDVQAQVDTQVAATLVGYLVQTKVAANLVSGQATQEASVQQVPTATPAPTETPLPPPPTPTPIPPTEAPPPPPPPTQAPVEAAVVSAPAPEISADVNTNCRQGPSTHYKIDGYLLVGAVSTVYGRDYSSNWWYIQNPSKTSAYCWVWSESTRVTGDASGVPVVAVSEYAEKTSGYYNNYYAGQYTGFYGDGYYKNGNWCQPYYLNGKVYCYPNNVFCDPNNWWSCNCGKNNCNINWNNCCNWTNNCKCNNVWPNTCGKINNCAPPTGSEYWKYCLKHPKCCGWN